MFNFRKVKPVEEGSKNKNQEDQKNYEKKVKELQDACDKFKEYIENNVTEKTKFSEIAEAFADKDTGFGNQMKKSWLLSRTSRRLNEMKKNLSKSKSKTFDPQNIDDFVKCFKFEREKSKNGYIKRSAIDDKEVADFFNHEMADIFNSKRISIQAGSAIQEISNKVDKTLEESRKAKDSAQTIIEEITNKVASIRSNTEISEKAREKLVAYLESIRKNLESAKGKAEEQIEKLGNVNSGLASPATMTDNQKGAVTKRTSTQLSKTKGQVDQLKAKTQQAKKAVQSVENKEDEAEKTERKNKLEERRLVLIDAFKYFNMLGEIDRPLNFLASSCDEDIAIIKRNNSGKISEEKKNDIISKLENKRDEIKKYEREWGNKIREPKNTFLKSKDCKYNAPIEEINEKINNLKEVMVVFENLVKEYKPIYKKLNEDVNEIFNDADLMEATSSFSEDGKTYIVRQSADFSTSNYEDPNIRKEVENLIIEDDSITLFPDREFYGFLSLRKVDLNKINEISGMVFYNHKLLKDIDLKNVKCIRRDAFRGCTALETINLSSIQTIEQDAFKGCTGIKKVILPKDETKAKEIKNIICKQTGKTAGDENNNNNNTIEFINAPEPATAT